MRQNQTAERKDAYRQNPQPNDRWLHKYAQYRTYVRQTKRQRHALRKFYRQHFTCLS